MSVTFLISLCLYEAYAQVYHLVQIIDITLNFVQ